MTAVTEPRAQTGFYCSTSGTFFTDKEALAEHYKSDFHKYNLKRKVAGLPPVTNEWFETRKAQLASISGNTTSPGQNVWYDPLTQKKFSSENTYLAHVRSKKYQELVKKSGNPAPQPLVYLKKQDETAQPPAPAPAPQQVKAPDFHVKRPSGPSKQEESAQELTEPQEDDSDWETVSSVSGNADAGEEAQKQKKEEDWEDWDVRRSLFDNHTSETFEANLEYMFHNFGFYFPNAEYLKDPQGLLQYLGRKLQYGHVPLYTRGDDPNAKQFRSLHAVQRHMVDRCQCKMVYDDNEEEYENFYDYSEQEDTADTGKALVAQDIEDMTLALSGLELLVPSGLSGKGTKVLGNRDLARYYKQGFRTIDDRQSVAVNKMLARYRSLGIATREGSTAEVAEQRARARYSSRHEHERLNMFMKSNVIRELPKNCPY